MSIIQITIIDVAAPTYVKTAKGGYNCVEVAYKKDGKVEGKKIMDFVSKPIFQQVQQMQVGKTYDVTTEKDARDYWQWTAINDAGAGAGVPASNAAPSASAGAVQESRPASGRVTGSNYATAEERARTQTLIGRQSSVNYALAFLTHNHAKTQFELKELFDTAELINSWVTTGNAMQAVMDMPDDIPV